MFHYEKNNDLLAVRTFEPKVGALNILGHILSNFGPIFKLAING